MISEDLEKIYARFRIEFYKKIFSLVKEREGSLSATEMMSAEVIFYLGNPTITKFADFVGVSAPNATYKVKKLIEKGYITKEESEDDRREFRLNVTDKFLTYFQCDSYGDYLMKQLPNVLNQEEINHLESILNKIVEKAL